MCVDTLLKKLKAEQAGSRDGFTEVDVVGLVGVVGIEVILSSLVSLGS